MEKNSYTIDFDLKNNPSEILRDINGLLVEIQKNSGIMGLGLHGKLSRTAFTYNAYFSSAFARFFSSFSSLFRSFSFCFSSSFRRRASSFFFLFSSFWRRITSLSWAICSSNWRPFSSFFRSLSSAFRLLSCSFLASQPYFSGSLGSFFFGLGPWVPKKTWCMILPRPHRSSMYNMTTII